MPTRLEHDKKDTTVLDTHLYKILTMLYLLLIFSFFRRKEIVDTLLPVCTHPDSIPSFPRVTTI